MDMISIVTEAITLIFQNFPLHKGDNLINIGLNMALSTTSGHINGKNMELVSYTLLKMKKNPLYLILKYSRSISWKRSTR